MSVWKPRTFPDADVQWIVMIIKKERPDLWERFVEHERRDEGYRDIAQELRAILHKNFEELLSADCSQLLFQIRTVARRESGNPL